jgi:pimeloyl-ACP methyl ester carboxylesterase
MKSRAFMHVAAWVIAVSATFPYAAGAQSSPRFDDVRVSTGVRLRYAEQGDGPAEPIILLHGLSDSWFSFSKVLPLLSTQRRVYALDQRGHGGSDKPASGYEMHHLAADVIAFMDAKRIDRAIILGHSMGGFVAQQIALAAPKRVSRLILVGSTTTPRTFAGITELDSIIRTLKDPVPRAFLREFQVSTVYDGVSSEFIDRAVEESTKLPAHAWRGLLAGLLAADPPTALGSSGIPTLVLWGDKDTYAVAAEQPELVALIRTATLKAYRKTGHAPHWERPSVFARDVLAFIARPVAN